MIYRAALALILSSAGPALAEDLQLAFPLDCTFGQDCHIQQYMDHDPSSAAQDYRCSGLTYDGHKGTDFALPDLAAMEAGVFVRAAAGGMVKGVRDGMEDGAPLSQVQGPICTFHCVTMANRLIPLPRVALTARLSRPKLFGKTPQPTAPVG